MANKITFGVPFGVFSDPERRAGRASGRQRARRRRG